MQVREVAAAAARHEYLLANSVGALQHDNAAPAMTGSNRTQEPGSTATDDSHVSGFHGESIAGRAIVDAHSSKRLNSASTQEHFLVESDTNSRCKHSSIGRQSPLVLEGYAEACRGATLSPPFESRGL